MIDVLTAFLELEESIRRLSEALHPPPRVIRVPRVRQPAPRRVQRTRVHGYAEWPEWGLAHLMECREPFCLTCARLERTEATA